MNFILNNHYWYSKIVFLNLKMFKYLKKINKYDGDLKLLNDINLYMIYEKKWRVH